MCHQEALVETIKSTILISSSFVDLLTCTGPPCPMNNIVSLIDVLPSMVNRSMENTLLSSLSMNTRINSLSLAILIITLLASKSHLPEAQVGSKLNSLQCRAKGGTLFRCSGSSLTLRMSSSYWLKYTRHVFHLLLYGIVRVVILRDTVLLKTEIQIRDDLEAFEHSHPYNRTDFTDVTGTFLKITRRFLPFKSK